MHPMSPPPIPLEIQQAAQHLPAGASLIFQEVTWDDYECLLASLEERAGLRISYDNGRPRNREPAEASRRWKSAKPRVRAELAKPFDSKFKR
jgi:hypothetical protein